MKNNDLAFEVNGIIITAEKVDEYSYKITTSDGRIYMAAQNMYGHYFLYETDNLDDVYEEKVERVNHGFGYDIEMCMKSVPTIQIKAFFGDWQLVNMQTAMTFLYNLEKGMNCSQDKRIELLRNHIKNAKIVADSFKFGIYDFRIKEKINRVYGYMEVL